MTEVTATETTATTTASEAGGGTSATTTATEAGKTEAGTTETAAADWRAGLEGEHAEFAKRFTTLKDLTDTALTFRKENSSMIRVPGEKAAAEDVAKFRKAIGVPEKAEEYEFDLGRDATDQDKAVQSVVAKVALENGVPKPALKAMTKAVAELAEAQLSETNRVAIENRGKAEAALKTEWGADYDSNVTLAQRAIKTFGKDHATTEFLNTVVNGQKIGDNPAMVKMFGNVGRRMGEGDFIGVVGAGERKSAQERIDTIMRANPPGTEKYKDPAVQRELTELNEKLAGSGPVERLA